MDAMYGRTDSLSIDISVQEIGRDGDQVRVKMEPPSSNVTIATELTESSLSGLYGIHASPLGLHAERWNSDTLVKL